MVAGPGLKNSISRHSVKKPSLSRAGGGSTRASGLKFKAAGAMTNTARAGIFSSRHAGSRGNFVYASSSSKLAKYGLHINRNGKISNKPNYSALRLALNGRSGGYSNSIRYVTPSYTTGNCSNCSGNSFMNTLSGIQQLMMMTQMFGEMFGLSSDKSDGNTKTTTTNTASGIGNINSFTDITKAENSLKSNYPTTDDLNSYLSGYQNVQQAESPVSEEILKNDISDYYAQIFKDADITPSNLQTKELSGSNDLSQISDDISNVEQLSQNYDSALSGISTAMNKYQSFISRYAQYSTLTSENQDAETAKNNKKIYDNAKQLYAKAQEIQQTLKTGKAAADAALADLQSTEKQYKALQDKKYELAEDKDKELGKLVEKYNKLIKKNKTDEANKIKNEISTLYELIAYQTDIQNSKGETYNFSNKDAAKKIVEDNSSQNTGGGNNSTGDYDYVGNPSYPDGSSLA